METPLPAVPLPQIGDTAETELDISYRRYLTWCRSIGVSPEQAAPKFRYARNGGVGSRGGGGLWSESSEKVKRAYERKREASRVENRFDAVPAPRGPCSDFQERG